MMIDTTGTSGPVVDTVARFRAPREKVWKTWTDPAIVPKWFMAVPGHLAPLVEVDLRELGAWRIVVRPGDGREHSDIRGHFFAIVPGRELTYSWHGNIPGGEYTTLVDVRFEDDGEGSRIQLVHGVFRSEADREAHAQGWTLCLDGFARVLGEARDEGCAP